MMIFPTYDTVDLFAGPGGWSVAAQRLGLREIGLEFDQAAHHTRRAAGFHTIRDDVRRWGPANFPNARGLIASPPCPTFSAAGKGSGRKQLDLVLGAINGMVDYHRRGWQWFSPEFEDERTGLTLEALRWPLEAIRLGRPYEWLAFEQVPTVLPVWQAMADVLRTEGYSVATGNLQAEQYGVPQTRKRAVLIARHVGTYDVIHAGSAQDVSLPDPTHSKYHTRDKTRLDPGVLPWVSMAQALGWEAGQPVEARFGNQEHSAARSADEPGNNSRQAGGATRPYARETDAPSPTLTGNVDRWQVGEQPEWPHERPATTIVGSFRPEVVAAPGYRTTTSRQNAEGSVRVSVQEAAALQSFPADYPWQGSRTKQYQQIGNAIPPLLAEAVLRQVAFSRPDGVVAA